MRCLESQIPIAILAYPHVQMSAVLGLEDLFVIANRMARQLDGPVLQISRLTKSTLKDTGESDFRAVILPPSLHPSRGREEKEIQDWLRARHRAGSLMCSVCAGAFWLGHSGLLAGRPVTTHWALEDEFRQSFPDARLEAEHLLIDDHDIVTAGGLMAWLDMGLFIVNRWLGAQLVAQTARHLLIDPGGREQRNYRSFRPSLTHGDGAILAVQLWLEGNMEAKTGVKSLAERARLSDRSFLRRFKAATGYTPSAYMQNLRIEKARGLLERSRLPIGEIAWKVGFQDLSAFSRLFRKTTGLTAGAYRKRFRVMET